MKSFRERVLGESGRKAKVNSKVKGNRNEVKVAKMLSDWTGAPFRRTPASGAIHVPLDWLCGDVFCADQKFDFPFSVETKHYKRITAGMEMKFWEQAVVDANRIDKIPMLITRENNYPKDTWLIHLPYYTIDFFKRNLIPYINIKNVYIRVHSMDLLKHDYHDFVRSIKRDG